MEKENKTGKKESFFTKMSGLLFEDTTEEKGENTQSATNTSGDGGPSKFVYSEAPQNAPLGVAIPGAAGVFDKRFYDGFLQIIEKNNVDGIDYFEFDKAKTANDAIVGMTEAMKFQVAFSTLKANSPTLTKDVLLETADFYLGKLGEEEKGFAAEMQNEIESEVNSKINQAKAKQEEIAKKQEMIVKLQGEMSALQGEIGTLSVEAQNNQAKIDATAKNFKISLDVLRAKIEQDKNNIKQFIN